MNMKLWGKLMSCKKCKGLKTKLNVKDRSKSVSQNLSSTPGQDEITNATSERDKVLEAFAALASASADFIRASGDLDPKDEKSIIRWSSKFSFFERYWGEALEKAGVTSLNIVGQEYSVGLQVEAINLEDFGPEDVLVIDEVLKPLLVYKGKSQETIKLLQLGRVVLKRKGE
jgi:hypothetical protein